METPFAALARTPQFIPFVYDYCDTWCERCPITGRCLLYAADRLRTSPDEPESVGTRAREGLELARAIVDTCDPSQKPVAELDLALCDVSTAPAEPAIGHPLEFLARHYAIQASQFLNSLPPPHAEPPPGSPLELIAWYHFMIAAKTYRALVSHFASEKVPALLADALGSAKVVLLAIDRSLLAWRSIAAGDDDARIGGLMELLEALKTGVEMRFPDARVFIRPGLDDPNGVREFRRTMSAGQSSGRSE